MLDSHVDKFDLGGGGSARRQKVAECCLHGGTIQSHQRADEPAEAFAGFTRTLDIIDFSDPSRNAELARAAEGPPPLMNAELMSGRLRQPQLLGCHPCAFHA